MTSASAGVVRVVGAAALKYCRKIPACKKALEEAIKQCKRVRCSFARHPGHHYWPGLGWCEHYSLTCWIQGAKGQPPIFRRQWPFPLRCVPNKPTGPTLE